MGSRPSGSWRSPAPGQWASTVPVDEAGEPVGPCVMWLDTRGARYSREVIGGPLMGYSPRALATWIRHTGGVPSPFGGDPVSHMLHLERDEPDIAAAARWYLEPVDYLSMRFTGRAAATHASMSAAWLTDNRRLDRLEYDPALVRRTGLDAAQAAAAGRDGLADRRGSPRGRRRSRHQPERAGGHRDAGPALGGARLRSDRRGRATHDDQHHLLDLAAVPAQEDRRAALDRDRSGARFARATWSPTTTRRPGSACAGCGRASPSTSRRATSA